MIATKNNIGNQLPAIKDGINNQSMSIKDRKISDTKKFKFRDANGNEIKELNYLVDYIDNSIEKYIIKKKFSAKSIYKNYNFNDYADLWSLVKKILSKIINKRSKKTTKCYRKKDYRVVK